jgi:hypothetical protein
MVPSGYRPGPDRGPKHRPVTIRVRRAPWSATLRLSVPAPAFNLTTYASYDTRVRHGFMTGLAGLARHLSEVPDAANYQC